MINELYLSNFKLHDETKLQLGGLTILTGMNGMGKSSLVQALLLLRQSFLSGDLMERGLNLNGVLIEAGLADELICQEASSNALIVDMVTSTGNLRFQYDYPSIGKYSTLMPKANDSINSLGKEELDACSLFTNDFHYISAFRFGPQESYNRDTSLVEYQHRLSSKMGYCDLVVHYLNHFGKTQIPIKNLGLTSENDEIPTTYSLNTQVQLWMRRISPMIKIEVEARDKSFYLHYKWDKTGGSQMAKVSALNTGFGITYVLPILVAILSAKPGSLILIENPEAHIHPSAQAVLMELVALAVKNGVQIVLETHSDHIVNGALVAVNKNRISTDDLSVYFFSRDDSNHTAVATQLELRPNGSIKGAPKGFFDQIDIDLNTLVGF